MNYFKMSFFDFIRNYIFIHMYFEVKARDNRGGIIEFPMKTYQYHSN